MRIHLFSLLFILFGIVLCINTIDHWHTIDHCLIIQEYIYNSCALITSRKERSFIRDVWLLFPLRRRVKWCFCIDTIHCSCCWHRCSCETVTKLLSQCVVPFSFQLPFLVVASRAILALIYVYVTREKKCWEHMEHWLGAVAMLFPWTPKCFFFQCRLGTTRPKRRTETFLGPLFDILSFLAAEHFYSRQEV